MILTICLNPVLQKTIVFDELIPNTVNRSNNDYFHISGKGINAARILTQLGQKNLHITQLGGKFKDHFIKEAAKEKIKLFYKNSDAEIRFCYTLITKNNNNVTELVEEGHKVKNFTEKNIYKLYKKKIKNCKAVLITGSKAPGYSENLFPDMVRYAKNLKKIVLLDYRGNDLLNSLQFSPDFIKPNLQEFKDTFLSDKNDCNRKDLILKIIEIYEKYNVKSIITDGGNEILYIDNNNVNSVCPKKVNIKNTTGCGDSFGAGFLTSFLASKDITCSIKKGIDCAAKNAQNIKPGSLY